MISLSLDLHDFESAVEGFAHGSHLRQHVWREIVYKSFPQMSEADMDFLWWVFRRNLWDDYFFEIGGKKRTHVGCEDYLHALAALHRGNRYCVRFKSDSDGKAHNAVCYSFMGKLHPLYVDDRKELQGFYAYIPDGWVIHRHQAPMPENGMVQRGKEDWWADLSVYDNKTIFPTYT